MLGAEKFHTSKMRARAGYMPEIELPSIKITVKK